MTTSSRPDHRSEDGVVRSLLWRLRARLVTPLPEDRVNSDLDRLLAVAWEQAHTMPSPDASAHPTVGAPVAGPARPVVATHVEVDELAARRRRVGVLPVASRAVAAGIAVLLVGFGFSTASDGPVTLTALLGRDAQPLPQASSDEVPPDAPETDPVAAPAPDELQAPEHGGADAPVAPEDPGPVDDGDVAPAPEPQDDADDTPAAPAPAPSAPSNSGTGSAPAPEDSGPDDADGTDGADEVDPPAEEAPIVAAPSPEAGLDGFGSGSRCEVDGAEDCVVDGSEDGADADDGDAVEDAEELARRRFKPKD